ncbi:ALPK3 kinase, partial [Centropus unirufus]|nr:ALPK3 kinase [Centropus unirufus]
RSTFCAIISQLTEETQPLFETTIKSRSVSEDADAKFTCIVTGYPQPEVTWYKDDQEMDRYCGLPKYEIFRHGNRHTLQLYKCREEDAGIYQASARNNKGIVSCSGVLEVGTMTEFKIHQKWFDKIKRKAEEKLREIEQGKRRGKENVEVEKLQGMSPDRLQRKRRLARDLNVQPGSSSWEKEDVAKVHVAGSQPRLREEKAEAKEQPLGAAPGFPAALVAPLKAEVTTNGDASLESVEENGKSFLAYIYETVEDLAAKPVAKDAAAKKKKKVELQEASKREEGGRDRASPSANPRFAPAVPSRRNARLRVANDQEEEKSPKTKELGKAGERDNQINGDVRFSLKELYLDKEEVPAAGKEEVGAKEEAEEAPLSSEVGQRGQRGAQKLEGHKAVGPKVAAAVGRGAQGLKPPPLSHPAAGSQQQGSKGEELRKETQENRAAGKRTNPRLRLQEPPKPPAPSPEEQPPSGKQAGGLSRAPGSQRGLSPPKQEEKGRGEVKKSGPSEPEGTRPAEPIPHRPGVKDKESQEAGGSDSKEPSPGTVPGEEGRTPLGQRETGRPAPPLAGVAKEEPLPSPAAGVVAQEVGSAPRGTQGMEAAAREVPSGAQLLPPCRAEMEIKEAAGPSLQEEPPAGPLGEEKATPGPAGPGGQEGGEQTASTLGQQPAAPPRPLEGGAEVQPPVPGSPGKPPEMSLEEKMQHKNLVSSLKNYLLLLLKMSDGGKDTTGGDAEPSDEEQPEEVPFPAIGIAGLSPRTSRKVLEKVENNQLFQTAENLPLTPRTSRRITGLIHEEFATSQELLARRPVPPKRRSRLGAGADGPPQLPVPSIVVGNAPGQPPPPPPPQPPARPESQSLGEPPAALPCATPEELASGARRKIYLPKPKVVEEEEEAMAESPGNSRSPAGSPRQGRRNAALLESPALAPSSPAEQRSPTLARKMDTLEVPKLYEEAKGDNSGDHEGHEDTRAEAQPGEAKKGNNPFKAPQVIRKIRAEQFSDASGNLKLWCQFFNVLSDSKLTWYKDEVPVAEAPRSAGDEGQAALAVVQASHKDCGLYRCVISNEDGTDSTEFLLSPEGEEPPPAWVGEEIEMTPMVFAKGLADAGYWGDKLFGRVVSEDMEVAAGFLSKACRARAIYGLEPVFESGHTGVIKVRNFIAFGTKNENSLVERNYDITIQECKIQNSSREYCKIFAAEARAIPDFGAVPEIIPLYLIYRPANNIPYATMEEDLGGRCEPYCVAERDGSLVARGTSEVVLKCCTFQHWVYQWTNGNILVTDMEGVGWKMTNVRIATNLKGFQGLKESCSPSLLEQFPASHQCNHYCRILGLKTLEPAKPKGSKSPSMGRKSTQSSPQLQKKGLASPQSVRKPAVSPKNSRRAPDPGSAESGRAGRP